MLSFLFYLSLQAFQFLFLWGDINYNHNYHLDYLIPLILVAIGTAFLKSVKTYHDFSLIQPFFFYEFAKRLKAFKSFHFRHLVIFLLLLVYLYPLVLCITKIQFLHLITFPINFHLI